MVLRDRAMISLSAQNSQEGKRRHPETNSFIGSLGMSGETQFSHTEERLILLQGRNLALQNTLLKSKCETKTFMLIS